MRFHLPICSIFILLVSNSVRAAEYIDALNPAAGNTEDAVIPIERSFSISPDSDDEPLPGEEVPPASMNDFISGSKLKYAFRSYAFDRKDSPESFSDAFTIGGRLEFTSGTWNSLSFLASYYTSIDITETNGGGTGLLTPSGDDINVLGEANLTYEFTDSTSPGLKMRLYRQRLPLPYMNEHDIRMLFSTYEAYMIGTQDSEFGYGFGHITRFKKYNSDEFVPMSQAAGVRNADEGITTLGLRYKVNHFWTVGGVNHFGWNMFNTLYLESAYNYELNEDIDIKLSAQYTDVDGVPQEFTDVAVRSSSTAE